MKRSLALLSLAIFAPSAMASSLLDLNYFPSEGGLWATSTLAMENSKYTLNNKTTSIKQSEVKTSSMVLRQNLAIGLLPGIEVGAELGLLFGGKIKTKGLSTAITNEKKYSGVEDPKIFTRYRFLTMEGFGWDVDFDGALSPKLASRKEPTVSTSGNAMSGGHRVDLGAKISGGPGEWSWASRFGLTWNGERTDKNAQTEIEQGSYSSSMDFSLSVEGQWQLEPMAFLGGVAYRQYGGSDYTLKGTGTVTEYGSVSDIALFLGGKWLLMPQLMTALNLEYAFAGDRDITSGASQFNHIERSVLSVAATGSFAF
jgi:hypothetical protein